MNAGGARSRRRWALALAAAASLVCGDGCARLRPLERRWPFPVIEDAGDAAVLRVLAERSRGPRSLYALLTLAFDLPQASGVAEAVVRYQAPGRIRIIAFKDILGSSRGIFDLALGPESFDLRFDGPDGKVRTAGPLDDLARAQPGFRAFGVFREAMFLPGRLPAAGAAELVRSPQSLLVRQAGAPGTGVEWELDPETLGVRRGRARAGDAVVEIEYLSYRRTGDHFFPDAFELRDPAHEVLVEGRLEEVELDPEWTEADFELEEE